ncbi:Cytosol aminopeptidase PepA [hydrothermal vent metagenome]|uniref:leucyl aminopeptidase n=1 Tax=hydrothermal vent metagenome TaxID=652676 RepID=A0A3B1BSH1_9ZZZZ
MKFPVKTRAVDNFKTDGIAICIFENELLKEPVASINRSLKGHLKRAMKAQDFTGKEGQVLSIDTLGLHKAGMIVALGLGKEKHLTTEKIRRAAASCASVMLKAGVANFAVDMAFQSLNKITPAILAQVVVEGICLTSYSFDGLKSEKEKKKIDSVTLLSGKKGDEAKIKNGAKKGAILAESACFARDLINLPGNVVTPSYMAEQAKKIAAKHHLKCSVLGPGAINRLKMGGLAGVARGSKEPARFIILEWMKGPRSQKPIVIVGKGLTFDTGGISLKPSGDMHEMKSDMSGGAAVLGALQAAAMLKLKVNLVGLVPATENMPGGQATKPGDVLTAMSGVTMEILNTDAEGRLILADGLAYAGRYKPDCVIDIATLTGACMVALGSHASGLFSNNEKLLNQILQSGEETGERLWPMPVWQEHEDDLKSDVADLKNIGPRGGGASTAAAFLKKHVKGKWAHIDIAGTAYSNKASRYIKKGGVGLGVRLMIDFIEKRAKL